MLSSGSLLLRLNSEYEQRRVLMRSAGELFVLPLEHFLRLPLSGCADMEVVPTQTVGDARVWKGLLGDDVCNSAYEAFSRVPLDDLVETGKLITPQHGRPMRVMMLLCAGISHGNVRLLLKYAFRGVAKRRTGSHGRFRKDFSTSSHTCYFPSVGSFPRRTRASFRTAFS